jgi:hypothetical protein
VTYNSVSESALNLIDAILKPQHRRPTIDAILRHPWLKQVPQRLRPATPAAVAAHAPATVPTAKAAAGTHAAFLHVPASS